MIKERNYGIDLLRLVLMFMVCMLHTLGQGGILGACEAGTLHYNVFWFIEILSYCAVDGFAIISGYMATDKPRKYEKLAEMWFQVFFYSFIITLFFTFIGVNKDWSIKDIIRCSFPTVFEKFWYFTSYFLLFLAMPILNKYLFELNEACAKKVLFFAVVLFSFSGLVADPFKMQGGYSALWLIVLYCIGVLAKKSKLFETKHSLSLIIMWACCIIVTWGVYVFIGDRSLVSFVSPTILLSGMIMVILFSRLRMKGTIISKLSPLAFGVYLFQLNQVVWNTVIKDRFAFVVSKNVYMGILFVFAFAAMIFISGLIVEFLRSKTAKLIRIPALCKRIVRIIDFGMTKLSVLMK